ncbi:MAG: hypothetical protein JSV68_07455 [Anaerolineaceae bacterium]|nr:MAG: hypothetical protein JSV68_07455 [Anaerolineaceae bacterium]
MDLFPSLLAGVAHAPASTIPHEIMSDGVLAVARALPLTHVVTLLKGMWLGWAGQTWLPSSLVPFAQKTPLPRFVDNRSTPGMPRHHQGGRTDQDHIWSASNRQAIKHGTDSRRKA